MENFSAGFSWHTLPWKLVKIASMQASLGKIILKFWKPGAKLFSCFQTAKSVFASHFSHAPEVKNISLSLNVSIKKVF